MGIATGSNGGESGASANGAASGSPGNGTGFGDWSWGSFVAAAREGKVPSFQLHPVYFPRARYKTTADCLTAASSQRLPLEVCR